MMINEINFVYYLLIVLVFLLAGELVVAVLAILRLTKKIADLKQKEFRIKENFSEKEEEIIDQTRQKASRVIKEALESAVEIEKSANLDQERLELLMNQKIDKATSQILEKYQQTLNEKIEASLKDYQKNLDSQVTQSKESLSRNTEALYQQEQEAVARYRQEKLSEVDQQIQEIIRQTAKEVIGSSLTVEEHEDLVIASLEKAKQNRLL